MARITRGRLPHVPVAAVVGMAPIPAAVLVPDRVVAEVPGPVAVRGDNNADRRPGSGIYIHALAINKNRDF